MAEKEYIEREKLGICRCNPEVFEDKGYAKGWNAAIDIIQSAPAADVRPVMRGKWVITTERFVPERICSSCKCRFPVLAGEGITEILNFCPNCGAWMGDMENEKA